jgi:hypothetical protein
VTEHVPALPPVVAVVQELALNAAPAPGALKLKMLAALVFRLPLAS